ncbi:MAG: FecR family protein [Bacteroidota bacterium]
MKTGEGYEAFTDRLVRWLAGELQETEARSLEEELRSDPEKEKLYREYLKVWESIGSAEEVRGMDLDAEWKLFEGKWEGSRETVQPGKVLELRRSLLRIAAVLLTGVLLFSGWYAYRQLSETIRYSALDEPLTVTLADGSRVSLNRGSELRSFRKTGEKYRKTILKGEAFFEVARDTLHPFVIEAEGTLVEVLGTSFNINAYHGSGEVVVTVHSGLVAFSPARDSKRQLVLKAGNSGKWDAGELTLVKEADPNTTAWLTRKLVFDHTPFAEVIRTINHVYGTSISIANPALADCPITVTFDDQVLSSVIAVLESTLSVRFNRDGERIIVSGEGCE